MDKEMLNAREKYLASAERFAHANDCSIVIDGTTITPTNKVKEMILCILQDEFRNACKEYYDALCNMGDVVWDEYMKTFES